MQDCHTLHENVNNLPSMYPTNGSFGGEPGTNGTGHHLADPHSAPREHALKNGDAVARNSSFLPIAICGMACRLPGKINNPEELWEFLLAKGDARGLVPETRYSNHGFYSPTKKPGAAISQYGYFLDSSVDLGTIDTSFFSLSRGEAEQMDPQQRLLLEVARESLDDAGEVKWKGANVGVYVGSFGNDWYDVMQKESERYGMHQIGISHDFALANRLSYEMDLRGPSMSIRTACSSGLTCLSEACQAIAKGDCTSAIVGGTSLILAPSLTTDISAQGALSPDGSCKTFSSQANGYARGEGVVAIYVKALRDAVRDGNAIHAVVVGAASNADGKTPGFSVPSSSAQEALIRHTYGIAGISESEISKTGFFEFHGTGTPVGDPIEAESVARIFGESGVHIGSIKPNLGHGEGASGITAVIKAVLALRHRTIPPNIKSLPRNDKIPFDEARLKIPLEATPWPEDRLHRVSVNSFGVGGANAHAIIDSAESFGVSHVNGLSCSKLEPLLDRPELLVFSANSMQSLKDMTTRYTEYLAKIPETTSLADIAYTLASGREQLPFRTFCIAAKNRIEMALPTASSKKEPALVMVFNGQGAQWPQMGRALLRSNATFRRTIRSLDDSIKDLGLSPDWKIEEELLKPARLSRCNEAEFSQPLCTAIQLALVDTLAALGVKPDAVVGHSSGEIAASYAAGGLTARNAIAVALLRGRASKMQTKSGAMAAVSLGRHDAKKYLVPGVVVACDNSPSSVTLSGEASDLKEVVGRIKRERPTAQTTILKIDKAYHSHHMVEIGYEYQAAMTKIGITGRNPSIPFFSTVTGCLIEKDGMSCDPFSAEYWRTNLESPVLFNKAVSSLLKDQTLSFENPVFVEIGPHAALTGPLRQISQACGAGTFQHIPTMLRGQNNIEVFLDTIGKLWVQHINVDFKALMPRRPCVPNLPRYPWNHQQRYWYESRVSREWRMREHPHHDLLGVRVPESSDTQPIWRNLLHLDNAPWLRDHKIRKDIIFPFAGHVAIAAEGVRQISGIQEGVELRHLMVNVALVLREETPTEIVSSFNRHRLTDSQDSQWWDFSISSYNGHGWTKHSSGQIRAVQDTCLGNAVIHEASVPHKIPMRQWYDRARRAGAGYGYHFRTIEEMNTSAGGEIGLAKAKARNNWHGDEAKYHLHPIVFDTYLQALCSAAHHGTRHGYRQLLPASIASLSLSRCTADDLTFLASCESLEDGFIGAGSCVANSKTVMKASGVIVNPLADDLDTEIKAPIGARIEWVPHTDFQNIGDLIKPSHEPAEYLEKLALLGQCAISLSQQALSGVNVNSYNEHIQKYKSWLVHQEVPSIRGADSVELLRRKDQIVTELLSTPAAAAATAIEQVCDAMPSILTGSREPLDIMSTNNTYAQLQEFLRPYDTSRFTQALGHSKPNLRVLELRAGAGMKTAATLNDLTRPDGSTLFSKYVYTDVLPGLVEAAKDRFRTIPNMSFTILDISKNPADQDFEDEPFDLVLATDVVHMTPNLNRSLNHVRKLLKPDGYLLLQQPPPGSLWIKYLLGSLPSWWCGAEDGRLDEPYVTLDRWKKELTAAGFQGHRGSIPDSSISSVLGTVIIARPSQDVACPKSVTVLCTPYDTEEAACLTNALEARGYRATYCSMTDIPPAGQDVIALVDSKKPFFNNMDEASFEQLKTFLVALDPSAGLLWVTHSSQVHCPDPRYAPIIGLARTLRSEMDLDFATCETDDLRSSSGFEAVVDVFCRFRERDTDAVPGPDFEYAITDGVTRVSRIFPLSPEDEFKAAEQSDRSILEIERPGRLNSLHWSAQPIAELRRDEVQLEVHATGLNFRDVLVGTGIITLPPSKRVFGYEAAGIIRRVGSEVKSLSVGDRVIAMGVGMFATIVNTSELLCEKLPDGMSFADGATMPIVFATAIYSLIDIARLEKGQSILIHSGCGGVGLAAIQISQMLGADIYTTVGSEEKIAYLMENFNIPRNRIFHSRNNSFVEAVMHETNGKGVDVVLNSLSGELLHATWRCVAKWGTMVEIGKRDLLGAGKLDMDMFLANRSYRCVAIDRMQEERPDLAQSLLHRMMEYIRQGCIRPVPLAAVFNGSAAGEAFRHMQEGNHIGKVVLSLRDNRGNIDLGDICTTYKVPFMLDSTASYLLIGGLGGLGRSVAHWMVQHGAKHLTFLSRSAGSKPEDTDFVCLLESMGCDVQIVRGSVTNLADVRRAVNGSRAPLKGIVQMSMVLRDQRFSLMTIEDWNNAVQPKILGTWNLHEACAQGVDLDFFLLFSSLSGIIGQPGQSNYASANTFLDAFVLFRNGLGLPCTAIDVGAMEGAGYLFENEDLMKKMQGTGWRAVDEDELLQAVENAMTKRQIQTPRKVAPSSEIIVGKNNMLLGISPTIPLSSPDSSARLRRDARMAVYHNTGAGIESNSSDDTDTLRAFLRNVQANPALLREPGTATLLALGIGKKLFTLLLKPEQEPNISLGLAELGLDSMVAVEMRSWWKLTFGLDITVLEMLAMGTLEALGKKAVKELAAGYDE
ncbi:hypothetical protein F4861DRAFT_545132 [Xylaria intraflava]|nr:hypothetical protein F4861DRAFT_545132 [Xylaria intraflava]